MPKIGRNEKCPCGSGKKFKKCCINKNRVVARAVEIPSSELQEYRVTGLINQYLRDRLKKKELNRG